jgi:hypothetical protein
MYQHIILGLGWEKRIDLGFHLWLHRFSHEAAVEHRLYW